MPLSPLCCALVKGHTWWNNPNTSRHAEQYLPMSKCLCVLCPSLVCQPTPVFTWQERPREEVNRRQQAEQRLLQVQHGSLPSISLQGSPLPLGSPLPQGPPLPQGSPLPAHSHQVRHNPHACPSHLLIFILSFLLSACSTRLLLQ